MASRTGGSGWTGTDYLLKGQFCPPDEIMAALECLRRETAADMALLLVAGPRGLLQTLCCAVSGDERGRELTDLLRRKPRLNPRRLLRPFTGPDEDAFPRNARRLLRRIGQTVDGHGGDSERLLGALDDWIVLGVPEALRGTRLAVAVFLRAAQALADMDSGTDITIVKRDREVLDLAVMVNATAQARVHHDAVVIDRVDQALDASAIVGNQIDLALAADKLVELARDVTDSDIAGYYAADFQARVLHLRAFSSDENAAVCLPPTLVIGGDQVAAVSAERTRPVLLDPQEGSKLAATIEVLNGASDVAEMATPVPGPLTGGPVLGVITLARYGRGGRAPNPFGAYDHALVRNVALRLALLRATADLEAASEMFTQLLSPTDDETTSDLGIRSDPAIPDDLVLALPDIARGLQTIRRLTNSHSATFRAALPSVQAKVAHDLALHRIAADPPERLDDERPIQQVDSGGVNCSAAVMGSARNVPFVDQEQSFDALRDGTNSEMSVPVVVEGLVVGVVNLESTSEQNYDTRRATVIAFAEHIASLIAGARLALSRRLETYALRVVSRAHELGQYTEAIGDAMDEHNATAELRGLINTQLDNIEYRARGLRSFDDDPDDEDDSGHLSSMPDLVDRAIERADLVRVEVMVEQLPWHSYDAVAVAHVRESLRHIFANVHGHRAVSREPAHVTVTQVAWGGRAHDVVSVTNPVRDRLDIHRACNVYRVPVTGSGGPGADGSLVDVPRFGAYLAGGHARALGGEVHLLALGENHARVCLMVPSPMPQTDDA